MNFYEKKNFFFAFHTGGFISRRHFSFMNLVTGGLVAEKTPKSSFTLFR